MRYPLADPVGRPENVAAVALVEHLDGCRRRDAEIRRLPALAREPIESRPGELDEIGRRCLPASEAEQYRPRPQTVRRVALDEPLALERADEAGGRALRKPGELSELADGRRVVLLDDQHEQLGATLDRPRSGRRRHESRASLIEWNSRPIP